MNAELQAISIIISFGALTILLNSKVCFVWLKHLFIEYILFCTYRDVADIVATHYGDEPPPIILVGHRYSFTFIVYFYYYECLLLLIHICFHLSVSLSYLSYGSTGHLSKQFCPICDIDLCMVPLLVFVLT